MKWNNFNYEGKEYDLTHLHPFTWGFTSPGIEGKRPERTYKFNVHFSDHCFTRDPLPGETPEDDRLYHAPKGPRIFCFKRHEYSLSLKVIISNIDTRTCWKTGMGNFFTAEIVDDSGTKVEYEVYFDVHKASHKGWMNMYVQSAFVRTDDYASTQPQKRKIDFHTIAYNRQSGKKIR